MAAKKSMTDGSSSAVPDPEMLAVARQLRREFELIQMENEFAVEEILTKVSILRKEFMQFHHYNPIEHVNSRVKSPESTLKKLIRLGVDPTPSGIRENVKDIAGVRITCSFIADTYRVLEALTSQDDVRVLTIKDYIKNPKPNGYKSLHALIEIPVFLSTGPVPVTVEVQVRTIAMDFWASLEHKIFYKYRGEIPPTLLAELTDAAESANKLDEKMESLHDEVVELGGDSENSIDLGAMPPMALPPELLHMLLTAQSDAIDPD